MNPANKSLITCCLRHSHPASNLATHAISFRACHAWRLPGFLPLGNTCGSPALQGPFTERRSALKFPPSYPDHPRLECTNSYGHKSKHMCVRVRVCVTCNLLNSRTATSCLQPLWPRVSEVVQDFVHSMSLSKTESSPRHEAERWTFSSSGCLARLSPKSNIPKPGPITSEWSAQPRNENNKHLTNNLTSASFYLKLSKRRQRHIGIEAKWGTATPQGCGENSPAPGTWPFQP